MHNAGLNSYMLAGQKAIFQMGPQERCKKGHSEGRIIQSQQFTSSRLLHTTPNHFLNNPTSPSSL